MGRKCNLDGVFAASECVDDETLFSLARGKLTQGDLSRVEAHLRDCADCRAVLGEAARSLASHHEEPSTLTQLARYQIRELIGAGASGVVYRAFDPDLQRTVAIKVIRPDVRGPSTFSSRMLREAQAMARLSDPFVVAVYDVGIQEGAVYLVMEHVNGQTLSDWLSAAPRSPGEILHVFTDAGKGLLAAHQKGLVHLDFKPENVLVAADGRALVTDFGLAREAEVGLTHATFDDEHSAAELYAPTRGLVGTPAYMAPELFDGGSATAQSDQFAYCVALFTALFGGHPFFAEEGISWSELSDRVRRGALQTPSFVRTKSSERIFRVLRRGLSADPAARYRDMSELLDALDEASRGGRTRRRAWLLAAVLCLFGLIFTVLRVGTNEEGSLPPPNPQAVRVAPKDDALRLEKQVKTSAEATPQKPTEEISPRKARTPERARAKPRKQRAKGDVRYRDWLKDPF